MKILITTHGSFAQGILESYQMIAGKTNQITAISLEHSGIGPYQEKVEAWLLSNVDEGVLILSDLKGGTPYNECYKFYLQNPSNVRLLSGLNLGMLLEVGLQLQQNYTLDDYVSIAYSSGKEAIDIAENIDQDDTLEF